jgi:hypothetical protein
LLRPIAHFAFARWELVAGALNVGVSRLMSFYWPSEGTRSNLHDERYVQPP